MDTNSSLCFFVLSAAMIIRSKRQKLRMKKNNIADSKDVDSNHEKNVGVNENENTINNVFERYKKYKSSFPWEPKGKYCQTIITMNNIENEKDQLDFLASMTFANGGIRKPNCPCCV